MLSSFPGSEFSKWRENLARRQEIKVKELFPDRDSERMEKLIPSSVIGKRYYGFLFSLDERIRVRK